MCSAWFPGFKRSLRSGSRAIFTYEREADRVAGAVMQMPNLNVQRQANDIKEKLPIHAKTITPIRTLKVQRQKVEGFGYDFGQVRVHHDETETAHALKARAFTVGQNIVFGSGQYSPRSAEGRKLLAYELTHTIQQSKNGSK